MNRVPLVVFEAIIVLCISAMIGLFLSGCTTAPSTPTAEIPVAVPIDCKAPDPGPKPDLSAMAQLTKASTPQTTITVMGAALASLAEDDARLRALMNHGH